jgi:uncharacterized phiE125 gp8 family phage protein
MAEPAILEGEPVTLAQAKLNARVESTREDGLIAGWIITGRRWVENYTGHILVARDVTEQFTGFSRLQLHAWPIATDAVPTVSYSDAAGSSVTVAAIGASLLRRPAWVVPAAGSRWPSIGYRTSVTVKIRAGYASPADVPAEFKSAILLIVKGLYDDRRLTPEIEASARLLCNEARRRRV